MRSGERGSVTAEFAIALPAIVLVLGASVAGVAVAGQSVRLQDAASATAREAARGEGTGAAARLVPGATATQWTVEDLECVRLAASAAFGPIAVPLSATACALGGGQ
jgi:hypothetical protein